MLKHTLQIRRDSFTSESLSSNQSEATQSPIYSSLEENVKTEANINELNERIVNSNANNLLSAAILSKKPSISSKKKQISKKSVKYKQQLEFSFYFYKIIFKKKEPES
jgi:hypothetical protein